MKVFCKNCKYLGKDMNNNVCRRNAPVPSIPLLDSNRSGSEWAIWPVIIPERDWCGEFVKKEIDNE